MVSRSASDVIGAFQAGLGGAFRYMAGPPISDDDLKVLADTSLAPSKLAEDPARAERILDTVRRALDPKRFPWMVSGDTPTDHELEASILASAAVVTAQRVATIRRHHDKNQQEQAVQAFLLELGLEQVPTRVIRTLTDAPPLGSFCAESMVGSRKAAVSIRLFDGRLMAVECKVSNSSTNSVKRLNNDAQVKADMWRRELGESQIVPAAVLSGVFNLGNARLAQSHELTLFWAHDLAPMAAFIEATRANS